MEKEVLFLCQIIKCQPCRNGGFLRLTCKQSSLTISKFPAKKLNFQTWFKRKSFLCQIISVNLVGIVAFFAWHGNKKVLKEEKNVICQADDPFQVKQSVSRLRSYYTTYSNKINTLDQQKFLLWYSYLSNKRTHRLTLF